MIIVKKLSNPTQCQSLSAAERALPAAQVALTLPAASRARTARHSGYSSGWIWPFGAEMECGETPDCIMEELMALWLSNTCMASI